MRQLRLAWGAFRNMIRAAARDPVWAIVAVITGPLRALPYLFTTAILLLFIALILFILFILLTMFVQATGLQQSMVHAVLNLAMTVTLFALAFRLWSGPLILHFGDMGDDTTHGTARFATDRETASLTQTGTGLLIGRDHRTGKLLRYDGPSHLLTMAPTRTGKGVGTIIPNLIDLDRPVICIDPKGENARITARQRRKFGPVHILDPFGATGYTSAAFNPLADLDPESLDAAEEAASIAAALVHDDPGQTGDVHWNEEAKALIGGVILHIASQRAAEAPSLTRLRETLTMPPAGFSGLLRDRQASDAAHGLVARAANRHLGKSDREAAGVLSSAQRHTHFLDSPRMSAVLDRSDFSFTDLKTGTATVFLVLPPDRLNSYARWLRLMITQSLMDMARTREANIPSSFHGSPPAKPVLYLLDEFAALGHLVPVEQAMGLMAGYGVQLWPILQDIHQLKATYGKKAGTFLSNAGVFQVFGVNDHDSAKLVSDLTGQETVIFTTTSHNLDSDQSGISRSEQHTARPLLTPDEIRTMHPDNQLLFLAGKRPVIATKLRYFDDQEFKGKFEARG